MLTSEENLYNIPFAPPPPPPVRYTLPCAIPGRGVTARNR